MKIIATLIHNLKSICVQVLVMQLISDPLQLLHDSKHHGTSFLATHRREQQVLKPGSIWPA
jgi:hypothetical protein